MKKKIKNITFFVIISMMMGCSNNQKTTENTSPIKSHADIELIVLDPGHFHASLLQKKKMEGISDTVRIYSPIGTGINQYLTSIQSYNERTDNPTCWVEQSYIADDYLSKMISDARGDVVILAGNNKKKAHYIAMAIQQGYHVIADKPMAINENDFNMLLESYRMAKNKNLVLYDLMTERYDLLNIIEKKLLQQKDLFGELQSGTPQEPAITMESVHHFYKNVSGKPLIRPAWYYDVEQQGEGIADVTTHLIDLVQWQCFPEQSLNYKTDIQMIDAKHWPVSISLAEFKQSTQSDSFPPYLQKYRKDGKLDVLANGSLNFAIKGIHIGMSVIWNYVAPEGSGDTFASIKKGSISTLKTIQNKKTNFVKELYIQKNRNITSSDFEEVLNEFVGKLQVEYPFISLKKEGEELYLIDIPQTERLGHEEHFNKVAKQFFHYIKQEDMPEWERHNTISKYYITTTAVEMAKKNTDK